MTTPNKTPRDVALLVGGVLALGLMAWTGVIAKHAIPSNLHFPITVVSRLVLAGLLLLVIFQEANWTLRTWIRRPSSIALLVFIATAATFGGLSFSDSE